MRTSGRCDSTRSPAWSPPPRNSASTSTSTGSGEKAARLDKRRGEFTMWNTDTYAYQEGTDPIYQSIPFYIGWQHGAAYGIFFDNSYRTHFDFGALFAGIRRVLRGGRRDELLLLPGAVDQEDPGPLCRSHRAHAHAAHVGARQSAEPVQLLSRVRGRRGGPQIPRRRSAARCAPPRYPLHERVPAFYLGHAALPEPQGLHGPRCGRRASKW